MPLSVLAAPNKTVEALSIIFINGKDNKICIVQYLVRKHSKMTRSLDDLSTMSYKDGGYEHMDAKFHRVIIDNETYYRKYKGYNNEYEELMDEETFVEMLMDEVVTEEIEINETDVRMAIESVESFYDQQLLLHYISYLKEQAGL